MKLLFGLIVIGAIEIADKTIEAANKTNAPAENKPQQTDLNTSVLEELRAISNQQKAANEEARSQQKAKWTDIGLLIVGVFYTVFAAMQWLAIQKQAKSNQLAAEAAKKSADAAIESIAMTRRQMRPFVTVHFNWPFRASSRDSRLRYILKNSGQTAAFIKTIQTSPWEGADWLDYDAERLVVPDGKLPTEAVLVEDGTAIQHAIFRGMDPLIADLINNGARRYLVRGLIVYDDIFGKRHWTRFSRIFKIDASSRGPGFIFPRAHRDEPNENEIDGEEEQNPN